jgi:hypothetical protein
MPSAMKICNATEYLNLTKSRCKLPKKIWVGGPLKISESEDLPFENSFSICHTEFLSLDLDRQICLNRQQTASMKYLPMHHDDDLRDSPSLTRLLPSPDWTDGLSQDAREWMRVNFPKSYISQHFRSYSAFTEKTPSPSNGLPPSK